MTKNTLIFDIDGTICKIKNDNESYADILPIQNVINKLIEYKNLGFNIVLFTSRNMQTYNSNLGLINKNTAPVLQAWLDKWKVPYDEILFGKPWVGKNGFYIDDRAIRPDEFTNLSIEEIQELLGK